MPKGVERKKQQLKKPKLSMMEKRALKRAKREGKAFPEIIKRPEPGDGQA